MNRDTIIIIVAINRRLHKCRREILFHIFIGFLVAATGIAVLVFIWTTFRDDESEIIKQTVSLGMTMFAAGIGGFFFKKALALREKVTLGEQWIAIYEDASRPPPSQLLREIEERILGWLEGF